MAVQVNTTVTRRNRAALPVIAERVGEVGAAMWSAFFLVGADLLVSRASAVAR